MLYIQGKLWRRIPGLEDHIIKFQVAGSEATFDETLDKVIDGIELDGDLPRLCREINDFI